MQSSCLRLMGRKLLVSLAMEGKFSRDGLQSLDEDDDMLTAMARELVTENGVGESAAAVWRQIQAENSNVFIPADIAPEPAPVVEDAPLTSLVPPAMTVRGGRQSSEVRIASAIDASANASQRGGSGGCAIPAVLRSSGKPKIAKVDHLPEPAISLDFRSSNAATWPFSRFSSRLMRASSVIASGP